MDSINSDIKYFEEKKIELSNSSSFSKLEKGYKETTFSREKYINLINELKSEFAMDKNCDVTFSYDEKTDRYDIISKDIKEPSFINDKAEKIVHLINRLNLYQGYQHGIINTINFISMLPKSRRDELLSEFQLICVEKPSWIYTSSWENAPCSDFAKLLLQIWQEHVDMYINFSALVKLLTRVKAVGFSTSLLIPEIEEEIKDCKNTLRVCSREFSDEIKTANVKFNILKNFKTAADYKVWESQIKEKIIKHGNFDDIVICSISNKCLTSAYKAIAEIINMEKYFGADIDAINLELSKIDDRRSAKLWLSFNVLRRLGYYGEEQYDMFMNEEIKRAGISLYEYHPAVVECGHTGMSMYWTLRELNFMFSNGIEAYIKLRLKNLDIEINF